MLAVVPHKSLKTGLWMPDEVVFRLRDHPVGLQLFRLLGYLWDEGLGFKAHFDIWI